MQKNTEIHTFRQKIEGWGKSQPSLKRKEAMETKDEKLNLLRDLAKEIWHDLSTEALVGILSTLITEEQLDALIEHLKQEAEDVKGNE